MATQKELAEYLDLSDRQIRNLARDGVLPGTKGKGGYDLGACRLAYIRYLRGLATKQIKAETGEDEAYDSEEELARLRHHQANLAALKEEEELKRLIPAEEVDRVWAGLIITFRTRMMQIPKAITARIIGETDEKKLEKELADEIAQGLEVLSNGSDIAENI